MAGLDFNKAFDKVTRYILVAELVKCGLEDIIVEAFITS